MKVRIDTTAHTIFTLFNNDVRLIKIITFSSPSQPPAKIFDLFVSNFPPGCIQILITAVFVVFSIPNEQRYWR